VHIQLFCRDDSLILTIKDNGKGYDALSSQAGGHGLSSISRRAKEMNAELTITSAPEGTTVHLQVPI
jgi:signal transduction histidine kinase